MKYNSVVEATNKVIAQYKLLLTVRQIYYRLISPPFQLFANTINNYKGFDKILTRARERDDVDWTRIEDRARSTHGGEGERLTFDTVQQYVDWVFDTINERYYDRKYWPDQPKYVEVWVEKEALSRLFEQACEPFRVITFPSRGYSSFTKVMEAKDRFDEADNPNTDEEAKDMIILHFGDHDPSGIDMTRDLERRFDQYGATVTIKRIGLNIDQVRSLNLPSNPTKSADARSPAYVAQFGNECWELDSIPPDQLQDMVREAVRAEVDQDVWDETKERIQEDREKIKEALESSKDAISKVAEKVKKALE